MGYFVVLSLLLLALLLAGLIVSISYSVLLVCKFCYGSSGGGEESISLLDAAKISGTKISTPVFGEYEWFKLAGSALFLLFCRAGWQNFSKSVLQMHWEGDDQARHTYLAAMSLSQCKQLTLMYCRF
jgi:hypothetical protein